MIKANELRIGNLIKYNDGGVFRVISIHEFGLDVEDDIETAYTEYEKFSPIPLTEEWLLKFGFEKDVAAFYLDINTVLFVSYNDDEFVHLKSNHLETIASIKYVHQLQNLYFALTGEELTIKEVNNEQ
jgi:hypothetical protein